MKELIKWLTKMEQMSNKFYIFAADFFKEDHELKHLLTHLAKDEEWHFKMMTMASEILLDDRLNPPLLTDWLLLNKSKLEAPFRSAADKIANGTIGRDELLASIVAIEYSEYNFIFLYVLNSLKFNNQEFAFAASKMRGHKKSIKRYLESSQNDKKYLNQIRALPQIWSTTILVVEDYEPICILLADILSSEGVVETTPSGNEGLKKIAGKFYDIILTDITTPTMSGIEFYKLAVKRDPLVSERFMFMMNTPTNEHLKFVKKNNIDYIEKPFSVEHIRDYVRDILTRLPKKSSLRVLRSNRTCGALAA